jgi:hypothetical protein
LGEQATPLKETIGDTSRWHRAPALLYAHFHPSA